MRTTEAAICMYDPVLKSELPINGEDCSKAHLIYMIKEMGKGEMSEGKVNRWLGYIQGVMVATGNMTLEEVKTHNKEWQDVEVSSDE